jgi:ferredoxin--NADP+ reductase
VLGAGGADLESLDSGVPLILKTITSKDYGPRAVEIVFEFGLKPVAFEGGERLEGVRFATADGTEVVREAQLAVTCIGYSSHGHGLELDGGKLRNDDGLIEPGLYVVGWAKRGPSGTVGTNRVEALAVAKKIDAELTAAGRPGAAGLSELLASRGIEPADYAAWRRIDESEIGRAAEGRVRRKWRSLIELQDAAKGVPL